MTLASDILDGQAHQARARTRTESPDEAAIYQRSDPRRDEVPHPPPPPNWRLKNDPIHGGDPGPVTDR